MSTVDLVLWHSQIDKVALAAYIVLEKIKQEVLGGFEPPSLDSKSRVLTVTP